MTARECFDPQRLKELQQSFRTIIYGRCMEMGEDLMPCDVQNEIDSLFGAHPYLRSVMNWRGLARKRFVVDIMESCGWSCDVSLVN